MSNIDDGAFDDDRPEPMSVADRLREIADEMDPPAPTPPARFQVRVSSGSICTHLFVITEGEQTIITDPLVGGLVESPGGWSIALVRV